MYVYVYGKFINIIALEQFYLCFAYITVGHLFFEGYKFQKKNKSTFSWKLFSWIKDRHLYDYD